MARAATAVAPRSEATFAAMAITARAATAASLTALLPQPLPDLCWTPPDIDMYGHLAACNFTQVCIALWRECPAEGPPFSRPLVDEECCKACVTPDHC